MNPLNNLTLVIIGPPAKRHSNDASLADRWWPGVVSRSSPLVLYKKFKSGLENERFLDLLPYKLRIGISQLRLSAHQLRIVTGRYSHNRIDGSMRLCTLCDRSDIEDEYHFVIFCPAYSHLRQQYINPYYYRHQSVYKFILLMKSTKLGTLKKLGKYVLESFLRETLFWII